MVLFFASLLHFFPNAFSSRRTILSENAVLKKENEILLRRVGKRIRGKLLELDISLSTRTIRQILQSFRRRGKIRRSLTRKNFLETQIQSIYAMDFLAVDTMLGERVAAVLLSFYICICLRSAVSSES